VDRHRAACTDRAGQVVGAEDRLARDVEAAHRPGVDRQPHRLCQVLGVHELGAQLPRQRQHGRGEPAHRPAGQQGTERVPAELRPGAALDDGRGADARDAEGRPERSTSSRSRSQAAFCRLYQEPLIPPVGQDSSTRRSLGPGL
jgi:hypothetical protein